MIYVALLRGINVGGKNKVDMKQLKALFEQTGMTAVTTYINSGNVIFSHPKSAPKELEATLEKVIEKRFGFAVKVLVRDLDNIRKVAAALPGTWQNDLHAKCDAMFLWETVDSPKLVEKLLIKPEFEEVRYIASTLLWRVDRKYITRSGMMRIAGTPLYKQMTIRNCNTLRKLLERMERIEE